MTFFRRESKSLVDCARAVTWLAIVLSLALGPPARAIAGTIPTDDAVVLAVLPPALVQHRERSSLGQRVSSEPRDVAETLQLVRMYLDADADSGDARYLDHAGNLLDAWSMQSTAELSVEILMARAEVAQRAHRFDQARVELDAILDREPDFVQARLTRAYVLMTQGNSRAALADCNGLRVMSAVSATNCATRARGLTGEAGRAYTDVQVVLNRARRGAGRNAELFELSLTAADLAERLGSNADAAAHYRLALALAPKSAFALGAYADFLLEQGDTATAYALIAADDERLGLQVRRAIAAKRLGHSDARALRAALSARFELMQQRGDATTTREYARFALDVTGDAQSALAAALGNWQVQREPEDVLLVMRAARAAQSRNGALHVSRWVAATHLEDIRLRDFESRRSG